MSSMVSATFYNCCGKLVGPGIPRGRGLVINKACVGGGFRASPASPLAIPRGRAASSYSSIGVLTSIPFFHLNTRSWDEQHATMPRQVTRDRSPCFRVSSLSSIVARRDRTPNSEFTGSERLPRTKESQKATLLPCPRFMSGHLAHS